MLQADTWPGGKWGLKALFPHQARHTPLCCREERRLLICREHHLHSHGLVICISNQLPGDAEAAGSQTLLEEQGGQRRVGCSVGHRWRHGLRACVQAQLERSSRCGPAWLAWPGGSSPCLRACSGCLRRPLRRRLASQSRGGFKGRCREKVKLSWCYAKPTRPHCAARGWFTTVENRNGWAGCISSHQQISVKIPQTVVLETGRVPRDGRPDLGAFQLFKTL